MTASAARFLILLLSTALTMVLVTASAGMAGLAILIYVTGKTVELSGRTLPYWPAAMPGFAIPGWSAPFYLAGGIIILVVGVPLSLSLLEKLYLALGKGQQGQQG